MSSDNEKEENKISRILEEVIEMRSDIKHLTDRMNTRVAEIEKLDNRVKQLEINLAVNDHKTNKAAGWFDYAFKGTIAILTSYIALKLGLK